MAERTRFANVSEEELRILIDNKDAKNTKKATAHAVKLYRSYLNEKGQDESFELFSVSELDDSLAKFYVELRKENGEVYKKTSLLAIRHGINRSLPVDVTDNKNFPKSCKAFQAMNAELKRLGAGGVEHHTPIRQEDLQKLYSYFNIFDAESLQEKVFFDIMIHFGRRGRENLRSLRVSDFALTSDASGSRFLYLKTDEQTKNHQDDPNTARGSMHEIPSQDEKCPVSTFLRYRRLLAPGGDCLFPRPLKSANQDGCHFSKVPLGHNKLGGMMASLSEKAELSQRYTNHCIRATSVHLLDVANVPSRHIMTVTGHKAESSLKTYTGYTDETIKKTMSHTISKGLGLHVSQDVVEKKPTNQRGNEPEPVMDNVDFLADSELEPISNSQFEVMLQEFHNPADPMDSELMNIPFPPERNGTVLQYNATHAFQALPAPVISGNSANVTINYNFISGPPGCRM